MADSLFAWTAFAAMLLIPYETKIHNPSTTSSVLRGALWGMIFSLGAITKASFLYFIVLIVPVLLMIRIRRCGLRSALVSLILLVACSLPATIYWLRFGLQALTNGWSASFGKAAPLYNVPFLVMLTGVIRDAPGMLLFGLFVIAGGVYAIAKRRNIEAKTTLMPLLFTVVFCAISLASSNRQLRYSFVGFVALPFLLAILMPGKEYVVSCRAASTVTILAFCFMGAAAVPMLHRADSRCLVGSQAVLAQAVESGAKRILLATDSSTLNINLMHVASAVSPSRPDVETNDLAWSASFGHPIEDDFREIDRSDLVVFQNEKALDFAFTNLRVSEYEQYTQKRFGSMPFKVVGGIRIYKANHN
jgi:hypothetical protein